MRWTVLLCVSLYCTELYTLMHVNVVHCKVCCTVLLFTIVLCTFCCTALHSALYIVLHWPVVHCKVCSTVLLFTIVLCTLCCTVVHSVLYCTVLKYTVNFVYSWTTQFGWHACRIHTQKKIVKLKPSVINIRISVQVFNFSSHCAGPKVILGLPWTKRYLMYISAKGWSPLDWLYTLL